MGIGSDARRKFTVIGDTANVVSCIEAESLSNFKLLWPRPYCAMCYFLSTTRRRISHKQFFVVESSAERGGARANIVGRRIVRRH